jgi:hypothetical protein
VSKDLQGANAYRYQRQISGGNQELIEALTFKHYLETQTLLPFDAAATGVASLSTEPVMLTLDDYLLGVYDMVGELMKFSITTMATTGTLPEHASAAPGEHDAMDEGQSERSVLTDMRLLRSLLEQLELKDSPLGRDVHKKLPVMKQCVEKVENAAYGLIVRGSERPKGWMPDIEPTAGGQVESY